MEKFCSEIEEFMTGAFIVIEGVDEAAKKSVLATIAARLAELDREIVLLDEQPVKSNTAQAISQLLRSKRRGLSPESRLLLRGAQLVESQRALKQGMQRGTIYLSPKGYVDFLVRSYYGGNSEEDYQAVNSIIAYAARRTPPTLSLLVDTTTNTSRPQDETKAAQAEKLRAGFLWEAKQRDMPIVFVGEDTQSAVDQAWRHVAAALHLEQEAVQQPTAVAEVLAKSPAAKLLKETNKAETPKPPSSYYVPSYLPDDIQCDYCDEVDRLLGARKKLVRQLTKYLQAQGNPEDRNIQEIAENVLAATKPVATAGKAFVTALSHTRPADTDALDTIARQHYENRADILSLTAYEPHNELDLVPFMVAEPDKQPSAHLNFDRWTYEAKTRALTEYMTNKRPKDALSHAHYDWQCFTETTSLVELSGELPDFERFVEYDTISPRNGYETPALIEEAGLSDAYDDIFDLSLQAQSALQARGYAAEAQLVTLLGHKQAWRLSLPGDVQFKLLKTNASVCMQMLAQITEKHPLLAEFVSSKR